MKRKLLLAVVALFAIAVTVLIVAWPRYLPAPYCYPRTVFTAEDMRARVDCHPNKYKLEIDEDTVVLFAFPDSLLDWVGPIFIIHVPSVYEVVLSMDGSIFSKGYNSSEGEIAIESVLNNPKLVSSILERAKEIEEGREP